jgi:hypothetical protein
MRSAHRLNKATGIVAVIVSLGFRKIEDCVSWFYPFSPRQSPCTASKYATTVSSDVFSLALVITAVFNLDYTNTSYGLCKIGGKKYNFVIN